MLNVHNISLTMVQNSLNEFQGHPRSSVITQFDIGVGHMTFGIADHCASVPKYRYERNWARIL